MYKQLRQTDTSDTVQDKFTQKKKNDSEIQKKKTIRFRYRLKYKSSHCQTLLLRPRPKTNQEKKRNEFLSTDNGLDSESE